MADWPVTFYGSLEHMAYLERVRVDVQNVNDALMNFLKDYGVQMSTKGRLDLEIHLFAVQELLANVTHDLSAGRAGGFRVAPDAALLSMRDTKALFDRAFAGSSNEAMASVLTALKLFLLETLEMQAHRVREIGAAAKKQAEREEAAAARALRESQAQAERAKKEADAARAKQAKADEARARAAEKEALARARAAEKEAKLAEKEAKAAEKAERERAAAAEKARKAAEAEAARAAKAAKAAEEKEAKAAVRAVADAKKAAAAAAKTKRVVEAHNKELEAFLAEAKAARDAPLVSTDDIKRVDVDEYPFAERIHARSDVRDYQFEIIRHMRKPGNTRLLLSLAPGLGKTFTALHVMMDRITRAVDKPRLFVIAVPSATLIEQWKHAAEAHFERFPRIFDIEEWRKRAAALKAADRRASTMSGVLIITHAMLHRMLPRSAEERKKVAKSTMAPRKANTTEPLSTYVQATDAGKDWASVFFCIDEGHRIGPNQVDRIAPIVRRAAGAIVMTATPVRNSVEDLHTIARMLATDEDYTAQPKRRPQDQEIENARVEMLAKKSRRFFAYNNYTATAADDNEHVSQQSASARVHQRKEYLKKGRLLQQCLSDFFNDKIAYMEITDQKSLAAALPAIVPIEERYVLPDTQELKELQTAYIADTSSQEKEIRDWVEENLELVKEQKIIQLNPDGSIPEIKLTSVQLTRDAQGNVIEDEKSNQLLNFMTIMEEHLNVGGAFLLKSRQICNRIKIRAAIEKIIYSLVEAMHLGRSENHVCFSNFVDDQGIDMEERVRRRAKYAGGRKPATRADTKAAAAASSAAAAAAEPEAVEVAEDTSSDSDDDEDREQQRAFDSSRMGVALMRELIADTMRKAGIPADDPRFQVRHISQSVSADDRERTRVAFNAGEIKILLVGPSGIEGLDLECVDNLHEIDTQWNNTIEEQFFGRGIRLRRRQCMTKDEYGNDVPATVRRYRYIVKTPKELEDARAEELEELKEKVDEENEQKFFKTEVERLKRVAAKEAEEKERPGFVVDSAGYQKPVPVRAPGVQGDVLDPEMYYARRQVPGEARFTRHPCALRTERDSADQRACNSCAAVIMPKEVRYSCPRHEYDICEACMTHDRAYVSRASTMNATLRRRLARRQTTITEVISEARIEYLGPARRPTAPRAWPATRRSNRAAAFADPELKLTHKTLPDQMERERVAMREQARSMAVAVASAAASVAAAAAPLAAPEKKKRKQRDEEPEEADDAEPAEDMLAEVDITDANTAPAYDYDPETAKRIRVELENMQSKLERLAAQEEAARRDAAVEFENIYEEDDIIYAGEEDETVEVGWGSAAGGGDDDDAEQPSDAKKDEEDEDADDPIWTSFKKFVPRSRVVIWNDARYHKIEEMMMFGSPDSLMTQIRLLKAAHFERWVQRPLLYGSRNNILNKLLGITWTKNSETGQVYKRENIPEMRQVVVDNDWARIVKVTKDGKTGTLFAVNRTNGSVACAAAKKPACAAAASSAACAAAAAACERVTHPVLQREAMTDETFRALQRCPREAVPQLPNYWLMLSLVSARGMVPRRVLFEQFGREDVERWEKDGVFRSISDARYLVRTPEKKWVDLLREVVYPAVLELERARVEDANKSSDKMVIDLASDDSSSK